MTYWSTVAAVIWGVGIYNLVEVLATEVIRRIEDRKAAKHFEETLAELEAYWASIEEKKPARKKAVAKKK